MKHNEKLSELYQSNIGKELYKKTEAIILSNNIGEDEKILIIGYAEKYLPLLQKYKIFMLQDLKIDRMMRFEKIFIFHYVEYEENLQYLFHRLEKSLVEGGEVIIISSKMYSVEFDKLELTYRNFILDKKITSIMKKYGFTSFKITPILDKYFGFLSVSFLSRFVVIQATLDDSCTISTGRFEPAS